MSRILPKPIESDFAAPGETSTIDGSLTVGEQLFITGVSSPAAITGINNDFAMPTTASVLRISASAASASITGFTNGAAGREILIENIGTTDSIQIDHDSASSVSANRILLDSSANLTLNVNGSLRLWWDPTTAKWRNAGGGGGGSSSSTGGLTIGKMIAISGGMFLP